VGFFLCVLCTEIVLCEYPNGKSCLFLHSFFFSELAVMFGICPESFWGNVIFIRINSAQLLLYEVHSHEISDFLRKIVI
jgi:hypothetical protein